MRALFLLPCSFFAFQHPAGAQPLTSEQLRQIDSVCPRTMPTFERVQCTNMLLAGGAPPCTGSVEERLTCLENRIAKQTREIVRLKYELERLNTPRVQALDGQYLSRH